MSIKMIINLKLSYLIILILKCQTGLCQEYEPINVSLPQFIAENGQSEIEGYRLDRIIDSYDRVQVYNYDDGCTLESVCPSSFNSQICKEYNFESGNLIHWAYENASPHATYEYDYKNRRVAVYGGWYQRKLIFDSLDRISFKSDGEYWTSNTSGWSGHNVSSSTFSYDSLNRLIFTESDFDIRETSEIRSGFGSIKNIYKKNNLVRIIREDTTTAYYAYEITDTLLIIEDFIYQIDTLVEHIISRNNLKKDRWTYNYSDSSTLRTKYSYSDDNEWEPSSYYESVYNSKNELIRYKNYKINDDTIRELSKDLYFYDDFGNLIDHFYLRYGELRDRHTYSFDARNNLLEQIEYRYIDDVEVPRVIVSFEYDEENRLIKHVVKNYKDNYYKTESFLFNKEGFLLERTIDDQTYQYFYTDCSGNTFISSNNDPQIDNIEINVFPNPSNASFFLKINSFNSEYRITISDLAGNIVEDDLIPKNQNIIEFGNNLFKGSYIIYITKGLKIIKSKVIIKL